MRRRNQPPRDDGAILIFALIIITVVSLVTGATLLQGGTNFAATVGLRNVASTAYAADAAAKLAINDLELGSNSADVATSGLPVDKNNNLIPWVYDANVDGSGCFGAGGTPKTPVAKTALDLPRVYEDSQSGTARTATVTCQPVSGTGVFATGPTNPLTAGAGGGGGAGSGGRGRALTILGTGAGALTLKVLGNGGNNKFSIHGDVADAGDLTVSNGNFYTNGSVTAASCTPSGAAVIADAGRNCNGPGSATDPFNNPPDGVAAVSPNISAVPTAVGVWSTTPPSNPSTAPTSSTACTSGGTGYFYPGYYNDANALTAATNLCATSIFLPGNYYFDFHNNTGDPTVGTWGHSAMSGGTGAGGSYDVWTINNTVIAGDTTVDGLTNKIPGRCANPIDKKNVTGVQFVFGGDSQVALNGSGSVEVCASTNVSHAPIAIYGLDGSGNPSRGGLAPGYATPTQSTNNNLTATSTGANTFAPTNGTLTQSIQASDSNRATFTHTANASDTATLVMAGLTPSGGVPAGSILKSATLKVWHSDQATGGSSSITPGLKLQVGTGAATATTNQPSAEPTATPTEDDIDVTADLAPVVNAGNLATAALLFSETSKKSATGVVDRASLVLSYFPPVLRGETTTAIPTNCLVSPPGPTHCDFINDGGGASFSGDFVVQGAAYIPNDSINLSLGTCNLCANAFVSIRWGLVANTAVLNSQNSFAFAYPVVSIPDAGPGLAAVTAVDLKVFLCDTSKSSCVDSSNAPLPGSTLALTSRVKITDPVDSSTGLVAPVAKQRQMQVLSWSEQR